MINGDQTQITEEEVANGSLCAKLGDGWYQNIGEDAYPVFDPTHGRVKEISKAGYATFYDAETAVTLSSNVTVFTGKKNGSWLSLTEQANTIPAQTAVVLKGAEGYFSFTPAASAPAITGENELLGTTAPLTATGSEYVLGKANETVGFYRAEEGSAIPEGKAYLVSASGVKGFVLSEGGATGIINLNDNLNLNEPIYNLSGQRLQKMQKGINIVGNKKVLK